MPHPLGQAAHSWHSSDPAGPIKSSHHFQSSWKRNFFLYLFICSKPKHWGWKTPEVEGRCWIWSQGKKKPQFYLKLNPGSLRAVCYWELQRKKNIYIKKKGMFHFRAVKIFLVCCFFFFLFFKILFGVCLWFWPKELGEFDMTLHEGCGKENRREKKGLGMIQGLAQNSWNDREDW